MLGTIALTLLAASPVWSYEVTVSAAGDALVVDADFRSPVRELDIDEPAVPFVREIVRVDERGTTPITNETWSVRCPSGCRIRYRFLLERAAQSLDDPDELARSGTTLYGSPGAWLVRPTDVPEGAQFELHVQTSPPVTFETGLERTETGFVGPAALMAVAPYSAFGPLESVSRDLGGEPVRIATQRTPRAKLLIDGATRAASLVKAALGRLPVHDPLILIVQGRGDEMHGKTLGAGGASSILFVGGETPSDVIERSWVPIHELVHMTLPSQPYRRRWLEEGCATYVEPIIRVRAGVISPEKYWGDLLDGLPRGVPSDDSDGFDGDRSWAATYWGGALYWFLADLEVRERSQGRCSALEALRGLIAAGGNIGVRWPLEKVLGTLDRTCGVDSFSRLYERFGRRRGHVELESMFAKLGVRIRDGAVRFDDSAPLASVRKAMTAH